MFNFKRLFSAITAMAVSVNMLGFMPCPAFAEAENENRHTFPFENYSIGYEVTGG